MRTPQTDRQKGGRKEEERERKSKREPDSQRETWVRVESEHLGGRGELQKEKERRQRQQRDRWELGRGWGGVRGWHRGPHRSPLPRQAQAPELELHYASLQKLPVSNSDITDREEGDGMKEDPSTDYACIAKNKPT